VKAGSTKERLQEETEIKQLYENAGNIKREEESMKSRLRMLGIVLAVSLLSAAGAAAQETRLFFTSMSPANSDNSKFFNEWARKVEADAKNAVTIDVKDGVATLATLQNVVERVQQDVAQIGWTVHSFYPGRFPLSEVAGLPFVADESEKASIAMWRLWKTGLLASEYQDIVPLWFGRSGNTYLHFGKTPKSIDNLVGVKVRVGGESDVITAKALGMSPQSIPSQDMYSALQRGTVEAVFTTFAGFPPYNLQEVTSYHFLAPLGSTTFVHFMSRKKFDALPVNVRQAIEANSGEAGTRAWGQFLDRIVLRTQNQLSESSKHTLVRLTPQQLADWQQRAGKPVIDKWLEKNPDGAKVLETYRKIYAEVKTGS
jgi:TRAP-type transport system periplasmic protein